MIPITADDLRKGDVFTLGADGLREYTVTSRGIASDDGQLLIIQLRERPELVLPRHTPLLGVTMYRTVEVPCVVARHQDGLIRGLHDMASGPPPVGVFCGRCDAETTAEVMARLAMEGGA